jgi:hypothetical protein
VYDRNSHQTGLGYLTYALKYAVSKHLVITTNLRTIRRHGSGSGRQVIASIRFMSAEWLHRFDESTTRFAELDHTRLQVVQRSFNKVILLLIMSQEVVPKRMLKKD